MGSVIPPKPPAADSPPTRVFPTRLGSGLLGQSSGEGAQSCSPTEPRG